MSNQFKIMWTLSPYLSIFSGNAGKYGLEKLFTQYNTTYHIHLASYFVTFYNRHIILLTLHVVLVLHTIFGGRLVNIFTNVLLYFL